MKITNKEYKKELKSLEERMIQAEQFAKKLPIFAKVILDRKLTGTEEYERYADEIKYPYAFNGVNRGFFSSDTPRNLTNYGKKHAEFLFSVGINNSSNFGQQIDNFGFTEMAEKQDVFFYDKWNTHFYATDEQITTLLENLGKWYEQAKEKNRKFIVLQKKKAAEEKLKEAQEELKRLN